MFHKHLFVFEERTMNRTAERQFERQREDAAIAASCSTRPITWTPMVRPAVTDDQVEAWIVGFGLTSEVEDEFGGWKDLSGTVYAAIAHQWVADKDAVGDIIGPVFWRWARANAAAVLGC
jgi:hypothetical protein